MNARYLSAIIVLATLAFSVVGADDHIKIRLSKSELAPSERVRIEIIQQPGATDQEQRKFGDLMMGGGTIVLMSGTSTVHRAEMFPVQAPGQSAEGLKFFHYVGIPGRSPVPTLPKGKYRAFIEMDNWKSNTQEFQIVE